MDANRLTSLINAVDALYGTHAVDSTDERAAGEAAANALSEYGTVGMATDVATAIGRAMEVGYVLALRDVRDGRVEL